MSTKKPTRTTTVEVATQTATRRGRTTSTDLDAAHLTDEEARVLRMRRGIAVPTDQPLTLKHTETDKARVALLAIEREMVLKLHQRTAEQTARKSKIVDSLRGTRKPKR